MARETRQPFFAAKPNLSSGCFGLCHELVDCREHDPELVIIPRVQFLELSGQPIV